MRNFAAEKKPCGLGRGRPRPRLGKLRVALLLRRNNPVVGAADARSPGPKICVENIILAAEKPRVRNFAGGKHSLGWGGIAPDLLS